MILATDEGRRKSSDIDPLRIADYSCYVRLHYTNIDNHGHGMENVITVFMQSPAIVSQQLPGRLQNIR